MLSGGPPSCASGSPLRLPTRRATDAILPYYCTWVIVEVVQTAAVVNNKCTVWMYLMYDYLPIHDTKTQSLPPPCEPWQRLLYVLLCVCVVLLIVHPNIASTNTIYTLCAE